MEHLITKRAPIIRHVPLSHFTEGLVWLLVIGVVVVARLFTQKLFDDVTSLWLIGLVIAFALLYYTVIYQSFNDKQRHYIKDIADVIFIGILATVAKDYSIYFFSLYILPIASAAMALDIMNSLVIASVASLFIAGNIILNSGINTTQPLYFGTFQIILLFILTIFTRTLAIQLRSEQEEREFAQSQLRRVDTKLQDIEAIEQEFVSITTHQLNTPLSIIRGYTSMLLEGDAGQLTAKQVEYINQVHGGSLRLMKIVKDLLGITHLDRDEFLAHNHTPVILNEMLPKVIAGLQQKASQNQISLKLSDADERLIIMGNETHLAEALNNLIDNAIKYSDPGQLIDVSALSEKSSTGHDVVIAVSDQGIGIPEAEQARIFQRFYRASNSMTKDAKGTGLGLYIVKRIVEYHGGSISFNSSVNQGTTFRLRFPLVKVKA